MLRQTILFLLVSSSVLVFNSCKKIDPIFMELEGSFSGTILIDEVYKFYNEGVMTQDTLVQTILVDDIIDLTIEGNAYETCSQSGVIGISGDSLQFIFNPDAENGQGCVPFFTAVPQFLYRFELSADSLKLDLLEEGVGELIGGQDRKYSRIKRQLRLRRN